MSPIPMLRVMIEPEPNPGDWNMAVDEALLESAITAQIATLRFYQWREPTVSLGYFQRPEDLLRDDRLSKLPNVRRLSGGGAILHDDELTYSLTLPAGQNLFRQPQELYDIVHGAICRVLTSAGFPVLFRGQTTKLVEEPLLCFQRQDAHDVTLRGIKVLGSAQRRRRGAILQHGSLIRRASAEARSILGLEDLSPSRLPENLAELLAEELVKVIAHSGSREFLSDFEIDWSNKICGQYSVGISRE